jgi:hypothetical protein
MEEAVDKFDEIIKFSHESISTKDARELLGINVHVKNNNQENNVTDTKKTCADRIIDEFHSRENYLHDIYQAINSNEPFDGYEEASDCLMEFPLSIDEYKLTEIALSTGGPGDWISIKSRVDDGQVLSVTYHFNDWFDHASMEVPEDSPMYEYAVNMIDLLGS